MHNLLGSGGGKNNQISKPLNHSNIVRFRVKLSEFAKKKKKKTHIYSNASFRVTCLLYVLMQILLWTSVT